ncbi:LPXTG cell wall anchor domain-containing protein [Solirubrobacter sp. CPCC 204708]|uniref:LPXTG cell wall anchor domain-containing protein n=1 Tax=Solirubrobacter deserti TaxID=2282478 RepID=A0ABT4RVB9_9ACTN|nr:LPXTG cell wall anchor domain-containing protein [Solirubrobacter deserti]MBE2316399.1 LPXTG cell wall anchor domain-containing protein [Solirubrobacter deserti]MDA0142523.1 LPXTG cell wall anchor domain-containing protein [Solirubrobacter deserti]
MSPRHALIIAATAIVLAPPSAYAQGAGDDQYNDPFGDEQEQEATPTATPAAPAATATPAPPSTAQATATPSVPQATATPVPAGPTLPRTGIDAWPLALGGALLLGSGLALRTRLRDQD